MDKYTSIAQAYPHPFFPLFVGAIVGLVLGAWIFGGPCG